MSTAQDDDRNRSMPLARFDHRRFPSGVSFVESSKSSLTNRIGLREFLLTIERQNRGQLPSRQKLNGGCQFDSCVAYFVSLFLIRFRLDFCHVLQRLDHRIEVRHHLRRQPLDQNCLEPVVLNQAAKHRLLFNLDKLDLALLLGEIGVSDRPAFRFDHLARNVVPVP